MLSKRYGVDAPRRGRLPGPTKRAIEALNRKLREGTYALESVPCCICGAQQQEGLSERDRHGVRTSVVACTRCGLVQTNPRPVAAAYADYYATDYQQVEYGQDRPDDAYFESQRARGKEIFEYLKAVSALPAAGRRVLEVGCNSGGILQFFREQGYQVSGYDLNETFVAYGRARHGLDLSAGTIAAVPVDLAPALIIYSHTLEHVLELDAELARVRSLLPEDGRLYVQVPGIKNLRPAYRMDFLSYIQFAHAYHFSLTSLRNVLEKSGFRVLHGDEGVNAVAVKTGVPTQFVPRNDYASVMAYLRGAERVRSLLWLAHIPGAVLQVARRRLAWPGPRR